MHYTYLKKKLKNTIYKFITTTLSKIKKLKIYIYIHLKRILVLLPIKTLLRNLKKYIIIVSYNLILIIVLKILHFLV